MWSTVVLLRWLTDWRYRYGYHGNLLLGSHWVTGALMKGETTVTTRTRNTELTRLPYVVFMPCQRSLGWWVFMGGWETLCNAQLRNGILVGQRKPSTYLNSFIMATNIGISSNAYGSGLNANAVNSKPKSWDERVTEFSSNLKDKNGFFENVAKKWRGFFKDISFLNT